MRVEESLYTGCATTSAGIELDGNVLIVLGEATGAASALRMAHTVMRDAIDGGAVRTLLHEAFGLDAERDADALSPRLVNLLAKAEASPSGEVRGQRHTMLGDRPVYSSDEGWT